MVNFGKQYSSTLLGNFREQSPPQRPMWCWGIIHAKVTWGMHHILYVIKELTIWKTCECDYWFVGRPCENTPVWESTGLTNLTSELCGVEHKCLDDPADQYKTCNHAYLKKCGGSNLLEGTQYTSLDQLKSIVESRMRHCKGELPPCKGTKV